MLLERHERNPVLAPNPDNAWECRAVFNPGAITMNEKIILLYRAVGWGAYISTLMRASSWDGLHFTRMDVTPAVKPDDHTRHYNAKGCEDPRIVKLEEEIYVTYTAFADRIRVALLRGADEELRSFENLGIISPPGGPPDNKNISFFPEKVRGAYVMLHRPMWDDKPCGIWISFSNKLTSWEIGQELIVPQEEWERRKIGAGPPPVKTDKGWLLIYHGVDPQRVYRAGAALLDLNDPTKVIGRLRQPILEPTEDYERRGDVPNVVFPTGAVLVGKRLFVYYGAADTVIAVATCDLDDLLVRF